MKILNKLFIVLMLIMPTISLAEESAAQANREQLIVILFKFSIVLAFLMGLYFGVATLMAFVSRANNPNDPKGSYPRIIGLFFVSVMLLNLNFTINTLVYSLNGTSSYCFTLDSQLSDTESISNCFDAETSVVTQSIRDRINSQISSKADFLNYLNIAISAIQFLGLIYFISSILKITKLSSGGSSQVSVKSVLIGLIASAALIDLHHTLEIIIYTVKSLGVSI